MKYEGNIRDGTKKGTGNAFFLIRIPYAFPGLLQPILCLQSGRPYFFFLFLIATTTAAVITAQADAMIPI